MENCFSEENQKRIQRRLHSNSERSRYAAYVGAHVLFRERLESAQAGIDAQSIAYECLCACFPPSDWLSRIAMNWGDAKKDNV